MQSKNLEKIKCVILNTIYFPLSSRGRRFMFLQQHLLLQDLVYLREDHQIHPMHSPTLLPLPPFTTCYPTRPPASQLRTSESKPKTFRMHSPLTQHEIKMDCLLYEYMSMVLLCKIHLSTFSRKCLVFIIFHQNVFLLCFLHFCENNGETMYFTASLSGWEK